MVEGPGFLVESVVVFFCAVAWDFFAFVVFDDAFPVPFVGVFSFESTVMTSLSASAAGLPAADAADELFVGTPAAFVVAFWVVDAKAGAVAGLDLIGGRSDLSA